MKRGLIALLFVSILLLSACAPRFSDEQMMKDPAGALSSCSEVSDDKQIDCYFKASKVLRESNLDVASQACFLMKDDGPKRDCFQQLINANNDIDKKLEICRKADIPDWKKGCLEELAKAESDAKKAISICNEIKDDNNFKEHCLNMISGSPANAGLDVKLLSCESRDGMDRDRCYQGIGTGLFETQPEKGVEVCNKIADKDMRSNCLNFFTSSPELVKLNPTLAVGICDSLILKDNCYRGVAQTLTASNPAKATDVCNKLSDEIQTSDCFGNVWFSFDSRVIQNFDFSMGLCKSLNLKRDDCYRRISGIMMNVDKTKAEQACSMISTSSSSGCMQERR